MSHHDTHLFKFRHWRNLDRRTLARADEESFRKLWTIEVSAGTFSDCLKHKTVFTDAHTKTELRNALLNGTRYLWFAEGVGLVKLRYEHSNGVVTEAELPNTRLLLKTENVFLCKLAICGPISGKTIIGTRLPLKSGASSEISVNLRIWIPRWNLHRRNMR